MDWQPGYIVNGKYRIESILGAGGFGSTYKVTHRCYFKRFQLPINSPLLLF